MCRCFLFHDVKVHLAMAPVAVMLNLHADALTAVCNWKYQRGRPTTGIKVAHFSPPFGATAVGLAQRAPTAYPTWSKPYCTVWPHCTISASFEVSQAQKALLLLPRTEKGSRSSPGVYHVGLALLQSESSTKTTDKLKDGPSMRPRPGPTPL